MFNMPPMPTPDSIDWSQIDDIYGWLARDEDGMVRVFLFKPTCYGGPNDQYCEMDHWRPTGHCLSYAAYRDVDHLVSYEQGTVNWKYSLLERPEELAA